MPTGVQTVARAMTVEDAISGRDRAMVDDGADALYRRITANTMRRLAKAQGWSVVSDITYTSVSEALYALRAAGRTKKTRDNTLAIVSEFMEWVRRQPGAGVAENPCAIIERVHSRGEIETDAPRSLTWVEAERLELVARRKEEANIAVGRSTARRADLFRVLRFTGRRIGEWVPATVGGKKDDAIRVRDVRLDTTPATLVIRPTVNKSRRKICVPIHPAIEGTLAAACRGKHPEDYVFESQPDKATWDADLEGAGIVKLTADGVASPHSLRKTYNTQLAVQGVGQLERKLLMGHAVHQDLTDGTYLDKNQLQQRLYADLCRLPWDGRSGKKCEESAQDNLTETPPKGDIPSVQPRTPQTRALESRPGAGEAAHQAVLGRVSMSRDAGHVSIALRSFGGVRSPSESGMPPEGLEPSGGCRFADERRIDAQDSRFGRLTGALLAADVVREAEQAPPSVPHHIRTARMKTAAKAAGAIAALIASLTSSAGDGGAGGGGGGVAALVQIARGYPTGWDCYLGDGCVYKATVTACVDCCNQNCPGGLYEGCVRGCLGQGPEDALRKVTTAAIRLQGHDCTAEELPDLVFTVEAAMSHPDQLVRDVATAIAGETPFVTVRAGRQG